MNPNRDHCEENCSEEPGNRALRDSLMDVAGLSELFKALADETRTRILYLLSQEELCVHSIAQVMEMSLPAVSHHLRLLKTMRLVSYRREGKHAYYRLNDDHVLELIQVAMDHYREGLEASHG
ncbi:MAG: metalloregulator ArsR/SmtB family transcription factor [Spirochaetales bacterium]|nr:metalloregulator ArsR/SmtB family transcription factor [Spirochaetales bacterium]